MRPFVDSSGLLADPAAMRARVEVDGYVCLRQAVDHDVLVEARDAIAGVLADHGWIAGDRDHDVPNLVPQVAPCVEGEDRYFEVYDDVQRLEEFHAVPHAPSLRRCLTALLGDSAFPHPLSIGRLVFPHNEAWTTPPHQDFPNNQGTPELYAAWMPLTDCPVERGGLSVLRGSHRLGLVPLEFSLGAGNRQARLDARHDQLHWVGGDLALGDVVIFHSLTVHRSLVNTTDEFRLSVDYRFQREGEPLTRECLEPHFGRESWTDVYRGWSRAELRHYWRDKAYTVAPWDPSLHQLPEDHVDEAVRTWLEWRRDHPPTERRRRRRGFLQKIAANRDGGSR